MEKFSQFRDKGTGIAPFFPIPAVPAGLQLPLYTLLFVIRLPLLITFTLAYFFVLCWLPIGSLGKKAALWCILGVPGIWWVDLQVDGVRRGSLSSKSALARLPRPSSIIVSSSTSPIDTLYLAAIFDPIFTVSYPHSRLLQRTTLFHSILRALLPPQPHPPRGSARNSDLMTLSELVRAHPKRIICVLPECTTTNGRGILPLSPALLNAPPGVRMFPTNLRYTPPDITTPLPGWWEAWKFLWNLCSRPTHTIRVRVAEAVYNTSGKDDEADSDMADGEADGLLDKRAEEAEVVMLDGAEKQVLDKIGEALARLGRVKRVGIGVKEKIEFIRMWTRRRR